MSETSPRSQEVGVSIENLTDVSERVQAQLRAFADRRDLVALPRGLYAQVPGGELQETIHDKSDCSYRDSSYTRTVSVGDNLVEVREVATNSYGSGIDLTFGTPEHHPRSVAYSQDDIASIPFYEEQQPDDNEFDAEVQETLKNTVFASYTGEQLLPRWDQRAHVRAKDPLARPVILEHLREGYLDPMPLDGPVHQITTYYDQSQATTLAKVVAQGKWSGLETTGWVPLDALEFYTTEVPHRQALALGLAHYAEKLIATGDQRHMDAVNSLLVQAGSQRANYVLAHERRVAFSDQLDHRASFVLGQLAADQTLARIFAPTLDRLDNFGRVHLAASRVQTFDNSPWVVDDETGLATPLLQPWFQVDRDDWSTPVDKTVSELADSRAQTA